MSDTVPDPELARAFGQGSNARIAGRPLTANPHAWSEMAARKAWSEGWLHCEAMWGIAAVRCVRPLPPVKMEAA